MITIAQDEKVIRDWNYAEINVGQTSLKKNLTVTNKRIIVSEESENNVDRNEIAVNRIVGINTHFTSIKKDKKKKGIILLILGIILTVAILAIAIATKTYGMLGGLIISLIIIGAAISCLLYKKMYGQLNVIFQTIIPVSGMRYGLSASVLPDVTNEKRAQEIIFQVNLTVAREIVDTLGSVVLGK